MAMDRKTLKQIARMAGGKLIGAGETSVDRISTDSRSLLPGDLFVALRGDRFDGHFYLESAYNRHAAGAIVEKCDPSLNCLPQIEVPDTVLALQQLAKSYREELSLKAVGITGSNGKTSVKEMISAVLAIRFKVVKTAGNLNNHIGVPLTILSADSRHDIGQMLKLRSQTAGVTNPSRP